MSLGSVEADPLTAAPVAADPPASAAADARRPAANRPSLTTKVTYGFGSVAAGVGNEALSRGTLTYFLNQVVGLPVALVGAAIAASIVVDAFIDPMIGQWSDNVRSRWGRRHPFMYASAIPTALGFYFLWNPPHTLSGGALLAFVLLMLLATRIAVSLYEIPSAALAPELAPDYDDRTGLMSFRYFFSVMGAMIIAILMNLVFIAVTPANPHAQLNRAGYGSYGVAAAILTFVAILISSLATHREIPRLRQPLRRTVTLGQTAREMLTVFSNRSLLSLIASGLISGLGSGIGGALSVYFIYHIWGLTPQAAVWFVVGVLPAIILGVILAPMVSRRFGKKRAMLGLLFAAVAINMIPLSLWSLHLMPPTGSPFLLPILIFDAFAASLLGIAGQVIVASMIADVVEDNAVRTGVRSEGLLFAANGLLPKLTGALGGFLGALILSAVHFPAHAVPGTVDPSILRTMVLIYLPISAGFSAASIAVLWFYRIDKASHERNQALLHASETVTSRSGTAA